MSGSSSRFKSVGAHRSHECGAEAHAGVPRPRRTSPLNHLVPGAHPTYYITQILKPEPWCALLYHSVWSPSGRFSSSPRSGVRRHSRSIPARTIPRSGRSITAGRVWTMEGTGRIVRHSLITFRRASKRLHRTPEGARACRPAPGSRSHFRRRLTEKICWSRPPGAPRPHLPRWTTPYRPAAPTFCPSQPPLRPSLPEAYSARG